MGLLDDAIREHLELKRRRGADPAEVEKQEREALGPVGAAAAVEDHAPAVEGEPPAEVAGEEPPHAVYDDDPDPFEDAHAALPPDAPGPSAAADREPEPEQPTEQHALEERGDDEPRPDAEPADEEGEDVLDETPEFLQEAPEHDRLWFEQRPPRDFDF